MFFKKSRGKLHKTFFTLSLFSLALAISAQRGNEEIPYGRYEELKEDLGAFYRVGYKDNYREITEIKEIRQGQLIETTNVLDSAVVGDGFFKVRDPQTGSLFYTRNGQFTLNLNREITTIEGYILEPVLQIDSFNFDVVKSVKLYVPSEGESLSSLDGIYFNFANEQEVVAPVVLSKKLESSTVDLQSTAIRMMEILERISQEPPKLQPDGIQTKIFLLKELFRASLEYPLQFDRGESSGYFSEDGTFINGEGGEKIVIRGVVVEVEKKTPYVSLRQIQTYQAINAIVQKTLTFLSLEE